MSDSDCRWFSSVESNADVAAGLVRRCAQGDSLEVRPSHQNWHRMQFRRCSTPACKGTGPDSSTAIQALATQACMTRERLIQRHTGSSSADGTPVKHPRFNRAGFRA